MESIKQHTLFWGSSYDRGLDTLLFMWPDVLEKYPDAQLHICYGWDLFVKANHNNPERMKWKERVSGLMKQKGINHHGRVGQDKLKEIRGECGIWAYPTWFPEINCITALECQNDGLVPVVMNDFALKETVGSGIKIDGDIKDFDVQQKYIDSLLAIMGDERKWREESKKAKKFAKSYYWENIAGGWHEVFKQPIENPKVTVYTPLYREGGFEMVKDSLDKQTYNNFEWLVVDDYEEDRSKLIKGDYIKYIRGDKALGKYDRPKGLRRANNLAWQNMSGEILVCIQDYISIPENGLESIVDIYRHNKDALIAPVDTKWIYDGESFTQKVFTNVRATGSGIRATDNPGDFEMNYGAIPKPILDDLNGWWEFGDIGIGYDNTEIAYRALESGYRILIDDTNICKAVYMEEAGVSNQGYWEELTEGDLPVKRDVKTDEKMYKELKGKK